MKENIFKDANNTSILHNRDDMIVCALSVQDLENQLMEVIQVVGKYGIAFNADSIRVGRSMMIDGAMITCKVTDWPVLTLNPEEGLMGPTRPLAKEK